MRPLLQLPHQPLPVDVMLPMLPLRHALRLHLPPDLPPTQPLPILGTRTLDWPDEAACAAFAAQLALRPALRDAFIELHGPLGAGKTTFVRHLLRALGVQGRIKSPTYAVLEPYSLPGLVVSHFDFYRFEDPREWEDAGFRELFAAPGLKLAEWPEKAAGGLPRADLVLSIEPLDAGRGDDAHATAAGDPDPPDTARQVRLDALSARGLELIG